jgi:polygalacturonase
MMNKREIKMMRIIILILSVLCANAVRAIDYNILDFGAKNDTCQISTQAIQNAIDACAKTGGRVVVPAGQYKTGTIVLRSNVHLYLEMGATLYGSTDLNDYRKMKSDYVSLRTQTTTIQLIYADKVEHVSIDGYGTIDGRGSAFKKLSWNDEGITRPHLLRFINSKDIVVKDITLKNSGCWMQHYLACDRVQIQGIKVFNRNNYNNDALDLDGCHDVIVSNLIADSDDDGITLKSTSPRLCENITIQNCVVSSHCNGIKLGTETNGGFKNINISNCIVKPSEDQSSQFFGHESKRGTSAVSLEITDGGLMENVNVSNILVEGTESPVFIRLGNRARGYAEGVPVEKVGRINGIHLSNITVNNAGKTGCSITGLPNHPVENIYLSNITITQQGGCKQIANPTDEKEKEYPEATMWGILPATGFFVNHARHVVFENIEVNTIEKDERPAFVKLDTLPE